MRVGGFLPPSTGAPQSGAARQAPYKRFAAGKTLAATKFIFGGADKKDGDPAGWACGAGGAHDVVLRDKSAGVRSGCRGPVPYSEGQIIS